MRSIRFIHLLPILIVQYKVSVVTHRNDFVKRQFELLLLTVVQFTLIS